MRILVNASVMVRVGFQAQRVLAHVFFKHRIGAHHVLFRADDV